MKTAFTIYLVFLAVTSIMVRFLDTTRFTKLKIFFMYASIEGLYILGCYFIVRGLN